MKILITSEFYQPSIGGAQEVVKQIGEHLAANGHQVIVATSHSDARPNTINGVRIEAFKISGNYVMGYKGEVERYSKFLLSEKFDVILNYAAQVWPTDIALPLLKRIKAKKVLVPCGFSALNRPEYQNYYKNMKSWLKKYDATIYLSENYRDINFARASGVSNIHLIPNGADEREFKKINRGRFREKFHIAQDTKIILSVGSHTGLKGHSEAIQIFTRSNINNSVLVIIGNDFGTGCLRNCVAASKRIKLNPLQVLKRKKIIIADLNRQDTLNAYADSTLFLFPSNIEASPLVLFESMASGLPYLASDVGNTKEITSWSGGGKILPTQIRNDYSYADIIKSATILEDLINNPAERERLGSSGRKAWADKFTWQKISVQYEQLFEDLLIKH